MWTHRLSVVTALATFALLLIGGIVHGTGSSLACPDWPLCFGQFFPKMEGNVFFEHGHRLFASLVGLLTVGLCVTGRKDRSSGSRWLWPATLLALLLVVFQGVLGGLTVIYKLPPVISLLHLCTSMLFFALLLSIACMSKGSPGRAQVSRRAYFALVVTAVLCYAQLTLGGLVRHTGAGLSCIELPFCKSGLLPLGEHPVVVFQAVHRLMAILLAVSVVVVSLLLPPLSGLARWIRLSLPALVAVQIGLGLWSVYSYLGLWQVTAHLGVGALLWGLLVVQLWLLSPSGAVWHATPGGSALVSEHGGAA